MAPKGRKSGGSKATGNGVGGEVLEELSGKPAQLSLDDGTMLEGWSFGAEKSVAGECVFNTGLCGYPESLTDPSYRGQILVLTFPLIGNYGVPSEKKSDKYNLPEFFESGQIHIRALVVSDYSYRNSHWNSFRSLAEWLKEEGVPAITGVDTRLLAKKIRTKGSMPARITVDGMKEVPFEDPNKTNLVSEVSIKTPVIYNEGKGDVTIVAVDCGIKYNIIRCLCDKGATVKVVPWDFDYTRPEEWSQIDGVFVSNGPGDPTTVWKSVTVLQTALNRDKPIFGICLGNQLLALAAGARTSKMKFGNRSMNQPCIDLFSKRCYITPQNHGYCVETSSLPEGWQPYFVNANDDSNEGICHVTKPFFSVQFHPEARGGPTDTDYLFDNFLDFVRTRKETGTLPTFQPMKLSYPPKIVVSKCLVLGSGGLSIGQAGEFDYSGSQCIKALKEEGIFTILINPNIATIQTSKGLADKIYFVPVTPEFVIDVIKKERPDSVLLTFGGQTALNCGIKLSEQGVFEKYNVRVLGTPISTIVATEDRDLFARKLAEIDVQVAPSDSANTVEDALKVAKRIGFPVILRAAFALGGLGSGFANNDEELVALAEKAFAVSPQVLIDKSLKGWKEIEYEVVRDCHDNCITVCNMENFDPLGIHTGDSIVIAPSQTLSNAEYFKLRRIALKVIRHLGVVGECNIQYALDPNSERVYVIEVNARLSRSSALASKATGYPLAFVAAKLALNKVLPEIPNSMTRRTSACFEPALDYVVVKFPRWDLSKFSNVDPSLGSAMKSVGEVMAIGRTFEEALQKAIRMVDGAAEGFESKDSVTDIDSILVNATPLRIFALAKAFESGYSVDKLYEMTAIDQWFLYKCENIVRCARVLKGKGNLDVIDATLLRHVKRLGFSDKGIAKLLGSKEDVVRERRKALGVTPFVKQIDTLAAEYPAFTNYLYMTYSGTEHDVHFNDNGTMVLGSGCYRIGSSVEFDWCGVSAIRTLRSIGFKSVMVNYNPETVSTDYDECDRLYFEELSFERVRDIYEAESSAGIVVSVGGQAPNNIALRLHESGVRILGTSPEDIDRAEDRNKFSSLLDSINVDQPAWSELSSVKEAQEFSDRVGYPVLVRPSYVLSGAAMNVAYNSDDLVQCLSQATNLSSEHPVVISKFIEEAKEIEMDAVAKNGEVILYAISEHVENAGVHSGDATLVLPAQNMYVETLRRVRLVTRKIAKALNITGPFNIQYLAKNNEIKVIECNVRASRTFPFVSKVFNRDFIETATKAMVGVPIPPFSASVLDFDFVAIKAPQFSFTRLHGADPVLGVEMASTGEVACFGENKYDAFLKALLASGFKTPKKSILLSTGPPKSKIAFADHANTLVNLGYELYATPGTAEFLTQRGIKCNVAYWPTDNKEPNVLNLLKSRTVDLVINIPKSHERTELSNGYMVRRRAADYGISLITNINCAKLFVESLEREKTHKLSVKSWDEYMREMM